VVKEYRFDVVPITLSLPEGTEVLVRQDPYDHGARLMAIETAATNLVERTFLYVPTDSAVNRFMKVRGIEVEWRFQPIGAVRCYTSAGVLFELVLP
jgi:hypothetical protein